MLILTLLKSGVYSLKSRMMRHASIRSSILLEALAALVEGRVIDGSIGMIALFD